MATERDHGVRNTHRVKTVHFGEVGRAVGEGKGSLGSDPHSARLAVRMADTASERQPEGKPHNAHDATKLLHCAYCSAHDEGIWNSQGLVGRPLATLPMRMGGLGLRLAVRCAPAAFWASWADALHMISEHTPDVANDVVRKLSNEEPQDGCFGELRAGANELDHKGFWWRPSWTELHEGSRPP